MSSIIFRAYTAFPFGAATPPAANAAAGRRLAHARVLDAAGTPNTDAAIATALARLWTPSLAAIHGPPAAPRSVRRWRRRGRPGARTAAARRGPRPDARHDMVAAAAIEASHPTRATYRTVHAMHVEAISHANARAAPTGGTPLRPLSYSTVRRVAMAVRGGR